MDYGSETDWTGTVGGTITLDLGSAFENVAVFGYLPSQSGSYTSTSTAGEITTHSIDVSTDNSAWKTVVNNGVWAANNSPKIDTFPRSTARYIKLTVGAVNSGMPIASEFGVGSRPPVKTSISDLKTLQLNRALLSGQLICKVMGNTFSIPAEFIGKTISTQIYTTSGKLIAQDRIKTALTRYVLEEKGLAAEGSYIVRFSIVR
jgi:hypothetical protein